MQVLALETSSKNSSIGYVEFPDQHDAPLVSTSNIELDVNTPTTRSLIPAIKEILALYETSLERLDLIAVTQGPGSFTGLRIGIATAKSLAYVLGCQVIGINTLELLAESHLSNPDTTSIDSPLTLYPFIDAQRNEVFVQPFSVDAHSGALKSEQGVSIISRDALVELIDQNSIAIGDHPKTIQALENSSKSHRHLKPNAVSLAKLARPLFQKELSGPDLRQQMLELAPNYFRKSAAEEKLS